ncbi:MAG: hypothetical protein ACYTFG_13640, partial [Planctomycetota bacterium]
LYTIPAATTPGAVGLLATATDAQPASNTVWINMTVAVNSPPTVSNETATPGLVQPGQSVVISALATDPHGMASVTADLTALGRSASQTMLDDGQVATSGDVTAGDNIYSCMITPAWSTTEGSKSIPVTVTDNLTISTNGSATVDVARFVLQHGAFMEDIHGSSASNIFVTGEYGQVYHYDGTKWRMMDPRPGSNTSWWGVHCESATSTWIGGQSGRVCHFDGKDWSTRDIPGAGNYTIRAFWSDGAGKTYAVGGRPGADANGSNGDDGYVVAYWTNSTSNWTLPPDSTNFDNLSSNGNDLNGIFGTSATNIVAVGDDGLIIHFNGTTWDDTNSISSTGNDLFGVWGFNNGTNSEYWAAAGRNRGTAARQVYYCANAPGSWTTVTSLPSGTGEVSLSLRGIYGSVSGTSLNGVYVTGSYDFGGGLGYGTVWEATDGQNFSQLTTGNNFFPNAPTRLILSDVWIDAGASDVWIVGRRSIQHYIPTGTPRWTEYSRGTYEDTRAVDVYSATRALTWDYPRRPSGGSTPTQISSIVHEINGGTWNEFTENTGSAWTGLQKYTMLNPPYSPGHPQICPRMYSVQMFSATDVYGVGDDGHVFFWNGNNSIGNDFTSQTQYGVSSADQRRLYAIWGLSATDFWFGGQGNLIYHYTGGGWSSPPSSSTLPGTARDITTIWGTSGTNVYAAIADSAVGTRTGGRGNLYQYTGSWASIAGSGSLPSVGSMANINSVWGSSASDVYVVGDNGFIHHYNGTWADISANLPGSSGIDLTAVFGDSSNSDVYVVGESLRVWVKRGSTWHALRGNGSTARFMGGDSQGGLVLLAGTKGITLTLEK